MGTKSGRKRRHRLQEALPATDGTVPDREPPADRVRPAQVAPGARGRPGPAPGDTPEPVLPAPAPGAGSAGTASRAADRLPPQALATDPTASSPETGAESSDPREDLTGMEDAAAAEAAWREVELTWSWPFGAQDEEPPTADPGSFDPRMLAGTAPLSALSLPADCAGPVVGRLALGLDLAERRAVALRDWLGAWQAGEADRLRRSLVHIRGLRQRALVLAMVVIFTLLIWALVAAGR